MIKNNPSIIEPPSSQPTTETQQELENLFMSDESRDGTDSVFDVRLSNNIYKPNRE